MLATSGRDGTARIWDLQGKEIAKLVGHQGEVSSVVFSSDGKMLATSGNDGTAHIWDLQGKEIAKLVGHQGEVSSVEFSSDGKMLATSGRDGTARIWDLQGRQIAEYQGEGYISKDFQFIATIPKDDLSIVKLWRIQTLDEMLDSACARLRPYLTTNPDISESDKQLCDK
jgi:WD40 repeat protein